MTGGRDDEGPTGRRRRDFDAPGRAPGEAWITALVALILIVAITIHALLLLEAILSGGVPNPHSTEGSLLDRPSRLPAWAARAA